LAVYNNTTFISTTPFSTCDAPSPRGVFRLNAANHSFGKFRLLSFPVPRWLTRTLRRRFPVNRESDLLGSYAAQSIAALSSNRLTTQVLCKARTCFAPHARSLRSSNCISLLNHRRRMLRGDADESLRQWRIGLGLCLCVVLFLWLRQFCCTWSDDGLGFQGA
jgi:hypothetical protein